MDTIGKDIFVEGTEQKMSVTSYIKETITMLQDMQIMERKQEHREGHQTHTIKERDLKDNPQQDDLVRKQKTVRAEETAVKKTDMQIMGEGRCDDAGTHIYIYHSIYGKTVPWASSYDHSTTLFKNIMTELPLRGQVPTERKL